MSLTIALDLDNTTADFTLDFCISLACSPQVQDRLLS